MPNPFQVYDERLNFFPVWPEHLRTATEFSLGWSYILAWTAIGLALLASVFFSCAAVCARQEMRAIRNRAAAAAASLRMQQHHQSWQPQMHCPRGLPLL